MSIVIECKRHGVVVSHTNQPICPICEASPAPGACQLCGEPLRGLFRKRCRNPHCISAVPPGPRPPVGHLIAALDHVGSRLRRDANAIRLDPPSVTFVTDNPGAPIRLAWTDSEGRFFTRDLETQHAINLIEDLARALRSRIGGAE